MASASDDDMIYISHSEPQYDPLVASFSESIAKDEEEQGDDTETDEDPMVIDLTGIPDVELPAAQEQPKKKQWTGWNGVEISRTASRAANTSKADVNATGPQAPSVQPSANTRGDETSNSAIFENLDKLSFRVPVNLSFGRFWTYEPYRGPLGEKVNIMYCKTFDQCEEAAGHFLGQPVIGFDMEWKSRGRNSNIQANISLIQIAAEKDIALFHIAALKGSTTQKLLAPTLRHIIESPEYIKCGVAVNSADGARLRQFMGLRPRGMFELSRFHHAVLGRVVSNKRISVGLAALSEKWLGAPLFKGSVRCSDWTKPLNPEQIKYAASDAYAGFRIFHAMEKKRLEKPEPVPRPDFAEKKLSRKEKQALQGDQPPAQPKVPEAQANPPQPKQRSVAAHTGKTPPAHPSARAAFHQPPDLPADLFPEEGASKTAVEAEKPAPDPSEVAALAAEAKASGILFNALCAQRRKMALATKMQDHSIIGDQKLRDLAQRKPRSVADLLAFPDCVDFASMAGFDLLAFVQRIAPLPG